jgi:outer membrane protein W
MYVDDAIGYDIHVGTDVRIWDRVFADLRVEYLKVQTEINFAGYINGNRVYYHGPYHVPFDHYSISLGLKYGF